MTARNPLVLISGAMKELPSGDTINGASGGGGALSIVTGTNAATTMVVNTLYVVDMSGWSTSDRIYTLPASPTAGDRVEILIQAGNASFELIIKGNTSQTINGGSAASEWSRLFITGEMATLLYVATNTWVVEDDGRIAMHGAMHLSTSATGEASGSYVYPTAVGGVWTVDKNVGAVCTAASDKITIRRACATILSATGFPNSNTTSVYAMVLELNGGASEYPINAAFLPPTSTDLGFGISRSRIFSLDDYVRYQYYSVNGSRGALGDPSGYCSMGMVEILS